MGLFDWFRGDSRPSTTITFGRDATGRDTTTVTRRDASGNEETDRAGTTAVRRQIANRDQARIDYENYRDRHPDRFSNMSDSDIASWRDSYIERRARMYETGEITTPGGASRFRQPQSGRENGNGGSGGTSSAQERTAAERSSDLRANNVTFRTASTQLYDSAVANNASSVTRMGRDVFNIARFRANVSESDAVLPTHSFLVTFAPMDWVSSRAIGEDIMSLLTMRCDNVILPSINLLQEQNIRRYGYGPVENVPYGVNVGDFTLQFIVDKGAAIVDFFEAWMNRIVNRDSYGGADMNSESDARYQTYKIKPYEVAYKDTYACSSVNVFIYDRAQNTVLEYNIYDVFPTGIQSMNMSWSEENNLMRLNVTFSFTDLRIRPKVSAFNQTAGFRNGIDTNPMNSLPPVPVTIAGLPDVPLVDPNSIVIPTDLVPPVTVIGDGDNAALRTFGTPRDTQPDPIQTPEVPTTTTRNAFGQPEIIA